MWIFLIILSLLVYLLYKVGTQNFLLHKLYRIPGPKPVPFLGNILWFLKESHKYDKMCVEKFGPIYSFYFGRSPVIMVTDKFLLEEILLKKSKYFVDRMSFHGVGKLMQKSLLRLKGYEWRRVRTLISPAFTPDKLRRMAPLIVETTQKIISNKIFDEENFKNIDIKKLFSEISISIIVKSVLGINLDEDIPLRLKYIKHAQKLLTIPITNVWFLTLNVFPEVSSIIDWLFPSGIVAKESLTFFENQIKQRFSEIKNTKNESFLNFMVNINLQKQETVLSFEEIMAQTILLILAGFETTASTMTFLSYLLSIHIDQQEEILKDIKDNVKELSSIQCDDLHECKLLEFAISETVRLYPPIDKIFRQSNEKVTLKLSNNQILNVKSGTTFGIPLHIIHHDKNIWNKPSSFDIHRWNTYQSNLKEKTNYLPFGLGPRSCIGKNLGLMEIKLVMILLLSNYKLKNRKNISEDLSFVKTGLSLLNNVKECIKIDLEPRK